MQREAGRELIVAVVKRHAPVEHLPHHRHHVVGLERDALMCVAHASSGAVRHLAVLQVIAGAGEQVVVAAVVVVQVGDDDVLDRVRIDAERRQALRRPA